MSYVDPAEQASWANQRSAARNVLGSQLAGFNFQRGAYQQQQGLDVNRLNTQFDQMRTKLPGRFAARGLLNSGIYGDKLQQYATQRQQGFSDLTAKYQQMLGSLGQQEDAANMTYGNTLSGVNDSEAIRRAQIASSLKGLA